MTDPRPIADRTIRELLHARKLLAESGQLTEAGAVLIDRALESLAALAQDGLPPIAPEGPFSMVPNTR